MVSSYDGDVLMMSVCNFLGDNTHIYIYIYIYIYICVYIYIYVCMYMYVCIYIYIYICVCVCLFVYTHTHTHINKLNEPCLTMYIRIYVKVGGTLSNGCTNCCYSFIY